MTLARTIRIRDCGGNARLAWAEGEEFVLPASLLGDGRVFARLDQHGDAVLADQAGTIEEDLARSARLAAAFTNRPPISSRLPFNYQIVPGSLRTAVARVVGRMQLSKLTRPGAFPLWPLDLTADFLADLTGAPSAVPPGPTPVVLTHDLDSPEGMQNLFDRFLDVEEAVGARSTSFVVPNKWPLDHQRLDELVQRGHEIGIHGYDHSNRTAFCPDHELHRRVSAAAVLLRRYQVRGYRAPSLLRTPRLLRALARHYRYDSSIPTSGGVFPVPGNGCASARPFHVQGILELPLSLPRDGSLLFLGCQPEQILDLWVRCAERISRAGGVIVLLTHCERRFSGDSRMRGVYRRFLEYVASSDRYVWTTAASLLDKIDGVAGRHTGASHE